jgi:hypothetical protein
MAGILLPMWYFWMSIAMIPTAIMLLLVIVIDRLDWRKWCPEGIAIRYARKHGGYVKYEHYASDEGEITMGKIEKIKGKGMLKPNWFGKTAVRFVPEEGSGYVEHLPKGLKVIHYIGTHPGPKKIMGVRAIRQMAEDYPEVFSESNPKRRIAYRFLTVPEIKILSDRPYEIQENVELWNAVQEIKAKITGNKYMYRVKDTILDTMVDKVDAKKHRKEPINIEDFMVVEEYKGPVEDKEEKGDNPGKKLITIGKILFSEIVDIVLAPDTSASIANAFSIIEANTRRKEQNRQSEMMSMGFLVLMVCIGIGVMVFLIFQVFKK